MSWVRQNEHWDDRSARKKVLQPILVLPFANVKLSSMVPKGCAAEEYRGRLVVVVCD